MQEIQKIISEYGPLIFEKILDTIEGKTGEVVVFGSFVLILAYFGVNSKEKLAKAYEYFERWSRARELRKEINRIRNNPDEHPEAQDKLWLVQCSFYNDTGNGSGEKPNDVGDLVFSVLNDEFSLGDIKPFLLRPFEFSVPHKNSDDVSKRTKKIARKWRKKVGADILLYGRVVSKANRLEIRAVVKEGYDGSYDKSMLNIELGELEEGKALSYSGDISDDLKALISSAVNVAVGQLVLDFQASPYRLTAGEVEKILKTLERLLDSGKGISAFSQEQMEEWQKAAADLSYNISCRTGNEEQQKKTTEHRKDLYEKAKRAGDQNKQAAYGVDYVISRRKTGLNEEADIEILHESIGVLDATIKAEKGDKEDRKRDTIAWARGQQVLLEEKYSALQGIASPEEYDVLIGKAKALYDWVKDKEFFLDVPDVEIILSLFIAKCYYAKSDISRFTKKDLKQAIEWIDRRSSYDAANYEASLIADEASLRADIFIGYAHVTYSEKVLEERRNEVKIERIPFGDNIPYKTQSQSKANESDDDFIEWYVKARRTLDQALNKVQHINAKETPLIWVDLLLARARAYAESASYDRFISSSVVSSRHQAIKDSRDASDLLSREEAPYEWAFTKLRLGDCLLSNALNLSGNAHGDELAESLAAYHLSKEVFLSSSGYLANWMWISARQAYCLTLLAERMEGGESGNQSHNEELEKAFEALSDGWLPVAKVLGLEDPTPGKGYSIDSSPFRAQPDTLEDLQKKTLLRSYTELQHSRGHFYTVRGYLTDNRDGDFSKAREILKYAMQCAEYQGDKFEMSIIAQDQDKLTGFEAALRSCQYENRPEGVGHSGGNIQ